MDEPMDTQTPTTEDKTVSALPKGYINNPFTIAIKGIGLLFQKAPMVALALVLLSAFAASTTAPGAYPAEENASITESESALSDSPAADTLPDAAAQVGDAEIVDMSGAMEPAMIIILAAIGVVLLFGALVIGSIITGVMSYTAAELAKGNDVSIKQATKATFDRLWSFIWLQVIITAKVLLWSLLFIIPGVVMAFRYSLANLSFFDSDKKLTGNAAIKDSLALTKGAWLTTFGAQMFFNIITLGIISPVVDTATKTVLYRQFVPLASSNSEKPKAHALSWISLGATILLAIVITSLMGYAFVNYGVSTLESAGI